MGKKIAAIRRNFARSKLDRRHVDPDPVVQFEKWMKEALASQLPEPTAMVLATASAQGIPSSRNVLLKGTENSDFVFYTNYNSRKGKDLAENPHASITFWWAELERQVQVMGTVKKTDETTSDQYFKSRPRKSRVGAWASEQSNELRSREELIKKFLVLSVKYAGRKVPRPPFWGGYKLTPHSIEFWQGRSNRLHDRIQYQKQENGSWEIKRLSP